MWGRFFNKVRQFLDHRTAWMTIVGAALVLRLLLLWQLHDQPFQGDSLYYYQVATDIAEGNSYSSYWPPGLPLFEAAVIKVFGAGTTAIRLSMIVWFLLFCRLLYNLLNRMHSRIAANIGLIAVAVYPAFIYQSVEPLTQLPTATLLLAMFFGLYKSQYVHKFSVQTIPRTPNLSLYWPWYIGLALGLVVLFRPSTGLFFLLVPTLIFFYSKKIIAPTIVTAIGIAIVSLWIWRVTENTGRFVPVNEANSRNFYLGNNAWTPHYRTWLYGSRWTYSPYNPEGFRIQIKEIEELPPEDRSSAFINAGLTEIKKRPGTFLWRSFNRLRVYFAFDTFAGSQVFARGGNSAIGYLVLALDGILYIGIGLSWLAFLFGQGKRELEGSYMRLTLAFVVAYTLPYLISFSHPAYHLPIVPFMLLPGAVFLSTALKNRTFQWRGGWKWKVSALIFLLVQVEWIWRVGFGGAGQ